MKSKNIPDTWTIFTDINLFSEKNVPNQNDHPNLVSYSLPKGSYVIFFDKFDKCTKDSYVTFDVNTMDAFSRIATSIASSTLLCCNTYISYPLFGLHRLDLLNKE